jgi:hypothetical protein
MLLLAEIIETNSCNREASARSGLAFTRHDDSESSNSKGNSVTCFKYLDEFDDFLKRHLEKYQYCSSGTNICLINFKTNFFLSWLIIPENPFLMKWKMITTFPVIVHSTPDVNHLIILQLF